MNFFVLLCFLAFVCESKHHWYCSKNKFEDELGGTFEDVLNEQSLSSPTPVEIKTAIQRYCNVPDGCCDSDCKSTGKCFSTFGFIVGVPCFFYFIIIIFIIIILLFLLFLFLIQLKFGD
jgi:hypothetical protein